MPNLYDICRTPYQTGEYGSRPFPVVMQLMSRGMDPPQCRQGSAPTEQRLEKCAREADWSENDLERYVKHWQLCWRIL